MTVEESWEHLKEYHTRFTKQRTDAFNFSLILLGLILSAIVTLSIEAWKNEAQQPNWIFGIIIFILAIFIIISALMFLGVDFRTTSFIIEAEKQLLKHEEKISIVSNIEGALCADIYLPFTIDKHVRDNYKSTKHKRIHAKLGTLIKVTYIGFIIIGILALVESIYFFII